MRDTLGWAIRGNQFEDGSRLEDWKLIYRDETWHWQYDTHELSYAIYEHDGQYWKLYHARFVRDSNKPVYEFDFGGQACRMVEVEYRRDAKSPHSNLPKKLGEKEWIRTYEFNSQIHVPVTMGQQDKKYGAPYTEGKW